MPARYPSRLAREWPWLLGSLSVGGVSIPLWIIGTLAKEGEPWIYALDWPLLRIAGVSAAVVGPLLYACAVLVRVAIRFVRFARS